MRLAVTVLLLGCAAPLAAQGYRIRLDSRLQNVAFRGVQLDSILASETVVGPNGGPETPDGYAVHCAAGDSYCTYFRPRARQLGIPIVTTADVSAWGFGIRGLRAHATVRLGFDLGDSDAWPGTDPALQMLDGYLEYAGERLTGRAGRQVLFSRLGATGFDGAAITVRVPRRGVEVTGYGGWGLARGVALPVTSPALNPLDDFQPRHRQFVAGADATWTGRATEIRLNYQREVDPRSDYFVSERFAFSASLRPAARLALAGGADYDIAAGWWGSAGVSVSYTTPRATASLEARRYRPHFDLWTIWGAFSPVPYQSLRANVSARASTRLQLHARGELYRFEAVDATTPLVTFERDGWRGELGVTVMPASGWVIDGGYTREFGPGAASTGNGVSISYTPTPAARFIAHASALDRPLEFRFSESAVTVWGIDGEADVRERLRVSLGATRYAEERRRPDAAAFDWRQWRLNARIVLLFARGGELDNLPPAIRRMPGGRSAR